MTGIRVVTSAAVAVSVLVLAGAATPPRVWGQASAPGATVRVDHAHRTALVVRAGSHDVGLVDGAKVRVPAARPVAIVVDSTNSALYTCDLTATSVRVPDVDSLRTFLAALGPYLPLVLQATTSPEVRVPGLPQASADLAAALGRLDAVIAGRRGLQRALRETLRALERLRPASGSDIGDKARSLRDSLKPECDTIGCRRLIAELLSAESGVARTKQALDSLLPQRSRNPSDEYKHADSLSSAARTALGDEEKVLAGAYGLEALVVAAANASDSIACGVVRFPADEGRDVKVTVGPRQTAELGRLADRRPYELKFTLLPEGWLHPALSVALLRVEGAVYPIYATTPADTMFQVIESGHKDYRWAYGLTLGLTTRWTDWRTGTQGWALWFPEVTINPTDDVRAIGAGAALSWGLLRVGAGWLWIRHDVLDGVTVGQRLISADLLKTRSEWGVGRFYVSLSITGWQPFERSAK